MKRSKKIYILLGVLAAALTATFGVMGYEEHKEQIRNSEEIILEIPKDSVKSVSWELDSKSFSFRKDDTWIYEADEAFLADEEKINGLLEQFASFGVSFVIREVEDYGQYGLEEPICRIQLETEEQSYEILLGNYSFAYEEDSADTYSEKDVYFTERQGEKKPLDTSRVESYLTSISSLGTIDYVTYNATEEELASYGMDAPELTVTVDYSFENEDGEENFDTFVLHVSRDPGERDSASETKETEETEESSDESSEEEITAYARVGESQIVYQITGVEYQNLMAAAYDDLRHPEVLWADFADITQLDISLDGKVYTFTSEERDEEQIWYYQEEETEISDLRTAFAYLEADRFTEEQPDGKEEISLTVYLENENYPKIEIKLYRYDGEYCLAAVDGESVSLVKRSAVVDLIEAVHGIVL